MREKTAVPIAPAGDLHRLRGTGHESHVRPRANRFLSSGHAVRVLACLVIILCSAAGLTGPAEAYNTFHAGRYKVKVFTDPDPLLSGQEGVITLKLIDSRTNEPVSGSRISAAIIEEIPATESTPEKRTLIASMTARQADDFGNYELKTKFPAGHTVYTLNATIAEVEGTASEPVMIGFPFSVKRPDGHPLGLPFMMAAIFIMTGSVAYVIRIRGKHSPADPQGFNLLDIPWIRRLFESSWLQPSLQVVLLAVFVILLLLGLFDIQDSARNLSTITVWTIWWAGIIFTFVLVGRLWCFMCPMGALSEWVSRIFKPDRMFPARLSNVWIANGAFITLTWLDVQLGVVRSPFVTSLILIGIVVIAVAVSLAYQRRTFCKYLCPIGGLIGIYSMFSAVELRSKDFDVCRNHKRKDCYLGNEKGLGCPMFEVLPSMDRNNFCNFCGECVKTCAHQNVTIRLRSFFRDAWASRRQYLDEAALAVGLVGVSIFVTGDMLEPWEEWVGKAVELFPSEMLGIEYAYYSGMLTKTILYFGISVLLIPGLMVMASALSNRMAGPENHGGLKKTFISFGYMFIPVGLSMHLAHNTSHLLKESKAIIPAFQRAVNTYTPLNIGEPNWLLGHEPLMDPSFVYVIQMSIFLVFYGFSLYAGWKIARKSYASREIAFRALVPMVLLSLVLMGINVYLLNLPMSTRHVH